MNITQLTPDQKRTILAKKLPGVIRLVPYHDMGNPQWEFFSEAEWYGCLNNDPLLDANAARAMEETLDDKSNILLEDDGFDTQLGSYIQCLEYVVEDTCAEEYIYQNIISATPTQRFDAFLFLLPEE